jgi:sugar phosphate isomerase/epimerase
MADINQMNGAGDTIDMIYEYREYIGHLHTYDGKIHCYPFDPEDPEQIALIKAYLTANPGGRISVEGGMPAAGEHHPFTSVENARRCLKALKSYVAKVQA